MFNLIELEGDGIRTGGRLLLALLPNLFGSYLGGTPAGAEKLIGHGNGTVDIYCMFGILAIATPVEAGKVVLLLVLGVAQMHPLFGYIILVSIRKILPGVAPCAISGGQGYRRHDIHSPGGVFNLGTIQSLMELELDRILVVRHRRAVSIGPPLLHRQACVAGGGGLGVGDGDGRAIRSYH